MENETRTMSAEGLEHAQAVMAKLNKKAAKMGLPEIKLNVSDPITTGDDFATFVHYEVSVDAQVIRYDGWTFAGTLQHLRTDQGVVTVVRIAPGFELQGDYREAQPNCDHCGHNRYRKDTYIVQHEDGTEKQVGSTCLKDFLGHDPKMILAWLGIALDMDYELVQARGFRGTKTTVNVLDFLAFTARQVRMYGWLSRGACYEEQRDREESTASQVSMQIGKVASKRKSSLTGKVSEELMPIDADLELARNALTWGREELEDTNDFTHNLKVSLSDPVVHEKTEGIVASLITVYQRAQQRKIENVQRDKLNAGSDHVGALKQRMEMTVTVLNVKCLESQWGSTGLHKMVTEDGNMITWFASGSASWLQQGETYKVKVTVKKHDEFRGAKQTVVTRVAVLEEIKS